MAWGGKDTAGVMAPPPAIYTGVLAAAVLADWALGLPQLRLQDPARSWTAGALCIGGAALGLWTLALFKAAGTNVIPNRPTTALVTTGPYRVSRNPGYICQTLIYAGLAVAARSRTALLGLPPLLLLIDRTVIRREERYLETLFGAAYRDFKAGVRRWM